MMLKGFFVATVFAFIVLAGGPAYAIFYNDSNVIEIGDGDPPEAPVDSGEVMYAQSGYLDGSAGDGGNLYAQSGYGGSGGGVNYGYDFSGGTSSATGTEAGGESGGVQGTEGNSVDGDAQTDEELEEEAIGTLIGSGAFSGFDAAQSGGGWWPSWMGGRSSRGSADALGASSEITIDSEGVREALRQKYDIRDLLARFNPQDRSMSAREYGLIAASTALKDANMGTVSFTASKFEIVYRARGYLFAIIPKTYPVRIAIVPEALNSGERVTVKLPWYRIFIRKFFATHDLEDEIDAVVMEAREKVTGANIDATAAVFGAVADFLKRKVGTIADSVMLGTPVP